MVIEIPKTIEEAEKRRMETSKKISECQRAIEVINKTLHPIINSLEMRARKAKILEARKIAQDEHTLVKEWIKEYNKNLSMAVIRHEGEIEKAVGTLMNASYRARDLIQSMKMRIQELLAENDALHKRIQEMELKNMLPAPDKGREAWRLDENQDIR